MEYIKRLDEKGRETEALYFMNHSGNISAVRAAKGQPRARLLQRTACATLERLGLNISLVSRLEGARKLSGIGKGGMSAIA